MKAQRGKCAVDIYRPIAVGFTRTDLLSDAQDGGMQKKPTSLLTVRSAVDIVSRIQDSSDPSDKRNKSRLVISTA